ncbi:MAG: peptidylprolyl isomerase [Thermodesulfobacteriota bacterium]
MTIKNGDKISVHYTGTLENGEVFDSSRNRGTLDFTVGAGQMIKGFDSAMVGRKESEQISITLAPAEAYGDRNEEMIFGMPRANFPEDMELEIGMQLQLADQQGQPIPATVAAIGDDEVQMDLNHPMAGKTLNFDIEIVKVN